MRIETTLNLTGSGPYAEAVRTELPAAGSLLAERARVGSPAATSVPGGRDQGWPGADPWQVDEHWTAVTAYLADLYLPNEG